MKIDVYHDTVCPWCRVGKRYLDRALAAWDGPHPELVWRPFLLDETVPAEGVDFRQYMAARKGEAALEPMFAAVRRAGEAVGLVFRLGRVRYATNTILSHRLIALAPEERRGGVIDGIHRAYFEDGRDIGVLEELVAIAGEAGVSEMDVRAAMDDRAGVEAVAREARRARGRGVSGVPLLVFDGAFAVFGAQPSEVLAAAMRRAAAAPGRFAPEPVARVG
ncbi:MAG: DsbA family oxidoreductase [Chloroflexota bacterium]|nr:DsbA family oxidoreductase [Chloroflexota bacterium]